jgi:hypothetical protein
MKMERYIEARMAFAALKGGADPERSHLYLQWAEEHAGAATEKLAETAAASVSEKQ